MRILYLGAAILAVWGIVCAWYYFQQEAVIFHPVPLAAEHEFRFDRPFEEHRIRVAHDVELSALLFPASRSPGESAVLYLHGNAGHLQDWGGHAGLYTAAGHDFVVVDYRGYGKSGGRIDGEEQLHADVDHIWSWTTARYPPGRVTLVGYSLGAALAARLACEAEEGPARLVLLAPFFSARDMARRLVPYVPVRLLRYPLRTDRALGECRRDLPITIFHGENDRTVPISQGRRLADLLDGRAEFVPLPGTGHQDVAGSPDFRRRMEALLAPVPAGEVRGPDGP